MPIKSRKSKFGANHQDQMHRVRRIVGQVSGIERLIAECRYCPEIVAQIRAARAALKSLEARIIERHFQHCVQNVLKVGTASQQKRKLNELMALFVRSEI